ncbi:MAG TPA: Gfo/Idh/MocA family oxidoreductase [Amaricoccus sp.]|uniref:Gfo/Idh/MocA family protein n=1 Tax=Amaricoccus sp. TaxID=1872485 RepID=UPI002CDD708C|nr:Gfo/Idh/MocA family oxidoreductase [Amaricoccus sp.]HMQ93178.1 Gfo/Idh/MocA family oxidoreductase [Amaricoccus sp.]HMR54082.1 Gfo/Idh/MocA family oxidoreductase [Amaricoccus sp.]HMR61527.1 Gfo/Idh/MocA family oxidoreductase [Amaricoccus sp.]HMU01077.1 Gfo/Idh/MocA family oxidoreductase [Amaricoccus sp.]
MSTIRYGLVGAGMMGQEHIRNIALMEGAEVAALADPDAGMRALAADLAGGPIRIFEDYRAMLAADLCDAYLIAAPNDLHFVMMKDVLATSRAIICEKPLAIRASECRELMRLAEGRAAPVWVAMEYRYMPPVARLIEEVHAGTAGAPRMMSVREHRFPFLKKVGDWNRFNARTGGTLVEKCCHFFDLMRVVLRADPVRVYASAGADVNHKEERYADVEPDILDNAFVTIDFANGTRAMLDLCMFAEGSYWQEVISVTGDRARVDAFVPGPSRFTRDRRERHAEIAISDRMERAERREIVHVDEQILRAGDHHGSTFFQHQRILDLVRRGRGVPEVGLVDGYWSVLVGEAAEASARQRKPIDLCADLAPAPGAARVG